MKWSTIPILCCLVSPGASITLLGVLQSVPELSAWYGYVNASSNGTAFLSNANNFTFLAPSNKAIRALLANDATALSPAAVDANLRYSLLNGGYPKLSFTPTTQFVETNLNDPNFTNLTSGQRVELVQGPGGEPQVITGNKSITTLPDTELVCVGGFVHIIDEFLTIPLTTILEITAANLAYFTSILNVGGYLNTANAGYVDNITRVPDVTYFIPNSAAALEDARNIIKTNGSTEALKALFEYHIVPGFVGYSPQLTNGTVLKTAQGENITITVQDDQIFVNKAKILTTDWIVANGVIHVIDTLLDRFDQSLPLPALPKSTNSTTSAPSPPTETPTSTPSMITTPTPALSASKSSSGLSTGAKIGIGLGAGIFALAILSALAFFCLRSRRRNQVWDSASRSASTPETGKNYVTTLPMHGGHHREMEDIGTTTTVSGGGPDIPPKSPSRAMRGEYF